MTFEGFTAGDEIGWGDESTVYIAQPASGGGGKPLALKVHGFQQESEGAALLEAAREQQRAAQTGCVSIAPIFALGVEGHSFYSVTPRFPRSLFSLIQGKVTVRPEGLESLTGQVLKALRDLRERQGRAHGNLKASNVFLSGDARLRDSDAYLSDFSTAKTQNYAGDVNAFGRVFYQLVRRREVQNFDWPIANSVEWGAMGPQGDATRALCNALLDPALATSPDPIAAAEMALKRSSHGGGGGLPLRPIAIGLAVLAVGAGGWFGLPVLLRTFHGTGKSATTHEAAKGDAAWIDRLTEELPKDSAGAGGDAYLDSRILEPVRQGHLPEARAAFDSWEARKVVSDGYDDLAGLGWTLPAGSISRLRGDLAASQPVLPQLRAIGHAAALLPQVQLQWRLLREPLDQLEKSGDPVLAKASAAVSQEAAGAPDLDRLLAGLKSQGERLPHLLASLAAVDRPRFAAEGKLAHFSGPVTGQVLRDWEEDARRFTPDPAAAERLRASWKKSFDELSSSIPAGTRDTARLQRSAGQAEAAAEASLTGMLPVDSEQRDHAVQEHLASLNQEARTLIPRPAAPVTPSPSVPTPTIPQVAPALPTMGAGDRENLERLLTRLRDTDLGSKSGGAMRTLRDNFVSELRQTTSPVFQKENAAFFQALTALSFREAATAPTLPGWLGPVPSPSGVTYTWTKWRLEFTLIPAEGDREACFLAAQEFPIGLFIDWMSQHGGNWSALDLHASPTVRGPRGWEPRGPGIGLRNDWTWPSTLGPGMTFYPSPAKAAAPEPPSGMTPLNYVSAKSAGAIAAELGCRLPTTEEWLRAYRRARSSGALGDDANLRDQRWEQQLAHVAGLFHSATYTFRDPPWPDGGAFIPAEMQGIARGEKARRARDGDDHYLWFRPVNGGSPNPLHDLVGNVAEFATDAEGGRFYVLGGSALSPAELDPGTAYLVPKASPYSDVGLRLALSAGGNKGQERDREEEAFRKALLLAPAKKP